MASYRFHTTRHSAGRAAERSLSFEDLKSVVNYPDQKMPTGRTGKGAHKGSVFKFLKRVDGQTLVAVAEIRNSDCWIITGYYES